MKNHRCWSCWRSGSRSSCAQKQLSTCVQFEECSFVINRCQIINNIFQIKSAFNWIYYRFGLSKQISSTTNTKCLKRGVGTRALVYDERDEDFKCVKCYRSVKCEIPCFPKMLLVTNITGQFIIFNSNFVS